MIILIITSLASTAVGEITYPYSSDFDIRNMIGFNDNTISAENIVAFIQERYPNSPMLNEADIGTCFISAGQSNNVNPAFLVATACLEEGLVLLAGQIRIQNVTMLLDTAYPVEIRRRTMLIAWIACVQ